MRLMALVVAMLMAASGAAAQGGDGLFVVLYRQGPDWRVGTPMAGQPGMKAHGAYMKRLFEAGASLAAGPTTDAPGGVAILRASSLAEAEERMRADPGVSSGMFVGEVHAWTPVLRSDQPLPALNGAPAARRP